MFLHSGRPLKAASGDLLAGHTRHYHLSDLQVASLPAWLCPLFDGLHPCSNDIGKRAMLNARYGADLPDPYVTPSACLRESHAPYNGPALT